MRGLIDGIRGVVAYFFGQRWVRFGIVGFAAAVTYWVAALLLQWWGLLPVLVNNALAYCIAFSVSYIGQRSWTFQSHGSHRSELPRFALVQGLGLALNTLIIAALMYGGMLYVPAMFIATFTVPIVVYTVSRVWVFRETSRLARPLRAVPPEERP